MTRHHGVSEPALDLNAKRQRQQHIASAQAITLGERKRDGGNRGRWVDDGPQVRVVEVQKIGADGVDEGRIRRIHALWATEDLHVRRARHAARNRYGRGHRRVTRHADRAADIVQKRPFGLMTDSGGKPFPGCISDEAAQNGGYNRRLCFIRHVRHSLHIDRHRAADMLAAADHPSAAAVQSVTACRAVKATIRMPSRVIR